MRAGPVRRRSVKADGTPSAADHEALRQAAEWFATLHASDAGAAAHARWQQWLAADPAHSAAWDRIEAVNRRFGALPAEPTLSALRAPGGRRAAAKKLLALFAVGGIAAAASRGESRDYLAALAAGERTAVGERRRLALADGSEVWINTDSALDVDIAADRRRLVLYRGEILLRSSRDPVGRRFLVDVPDGRLHASASRFGVRRESGSTSLAVFDGALRLDLAAGGAPRMIAAGRQLRFGPGWAGADQPADDLQAAWTRGRLSVDRMRLDRFVADLRRYWRGHIGCAPAVAGMLLTGSYPLDDIDRILAMLEKTLPLRIRRVMPGWVTLEPSA